MSETVSGEELEKINGYAREPLTEDKVLDQCSQMWETFAGGFYVQSGNNGLHRCFRLVGGGTLEGV